MRQGFSVLSVLALVMTCTAAQAQPLAFPTAEGFGRFAQGGRGGKAYLINSLSSASGSGGSCTAGGCSGGTITFRDCLFDRFAVGARTCIFRLGGIIDWPCESCYASFPPYLTIAGQTAPGNGIMIKSMQLEVRNTHNVIIRHLRVRPSETVPTPSTAGAISTEGIGGPIVHDVIVDHCSVGWDSDDTIGGGSSYNVTFQWTMVSEGLNVTDISKVGLWRPGNAGVGNGTVSLLHNYFANHNYRALNFASGDGQFVNNVEYNIASTLAMYAYPVDTFRIRMDMQNNYFKPGPQSVPGAPKISTLGCGYDAFVKCPTVAASAVNVFGNVHTVLRPSAAAGSETAMVSQVGSPLVPLTTLTTNPYGFPVIASQTSAAQAVTDVLAKVGATVPSRDSIDQRSITDFTAGTGRMDAATVAAYGGYPTYASGTPYTDTDGDGMSDAWELAHGLNPSNPADGPSIAANGYSNLENFLNELAGDPTGIQTEPDITSNLVAHWPFDQTSGAATDVSGNNNTGTLMNGASYTSGYTGNALVLDGISHFVQVADAASLDLTGAYTIAAWVYPTSSLTTWTTVAIKNYTYYLYAGSAGVCGAGGVLGGHATNQHACQATPLTANTWTHLAVTADGTTVRLYRNGTEVATAASTSGPLATAGTLQLGASQYGEYFPGRLDDLRLYARALSALDVSTLSTVTPPLTPPTNVRIISGSP